MKVKPVVLFAVVLAVASSLFACTAQNPNRPTMSFTAPLAQQPANGVIYNYNQQPVTLVITNSARTGGDTIVYNVEVASDSGFANKVFTRDGIPEGSGGTTAVTISVLNGNANYYWRWRAVVSGIAGEPSTTQSFFVKPNIVLNPPTLLTPASGASVNVPRPTFTVVNSTFSGSPGPITYEFQVSATSNFNSLIASGSVTQSAAQTSFTPASDLPVGTTFWRARARDLTNGVDSPFASASFERKAGLDLSTVIYQLGPNIASWPETKTITNVTFDHDAGQLCISATGEDWPAVPFPFDESVTVEGNQWSFVQINGQWYGGANSWYRPGQECKTEGGADYFSDGFPGIQPIGSVRLHPGDVWAVALSTPARAWPAGRSLDHRSNVVFIVW
ncbi:MAG TPA: hypothetical protein VLT86_16190 [Vicinamibacterales bacterium]|nr:hypothetical protein [Vicinamibacterales bacterium]